MSDIFDERSPKTHANYVVSLCLKHGFKGPESLPCPLCERTAREQAEARLAEKDRIYLDRLDDFEQLSKAHAALKAELERLRRMEEHHKLFPVLDAKWLDPECHYGCRSLVFKNERDALKLKLEVATPLLAKLAAIARIHELYESEPCNNPRHPDDRVVAWSGHGNEYVEVTLGECRKAQEALSQLNGDGVQESTTSGTLKAFKQITGALLKPGHADAPGSLG